MDAVPAHMASHRNATRTLADGEYRSTTAALCGACTGGPGLVNDF